MVMKLFLAGSCLISYNAFEPGSINCNLKMGAVCLSPVTFSAKLAFKYRLKSSNVKLRFLIRVLLTLQYKDSL